MSMIDAVENLTMTSREIAELTNKNHADVLRGALSYMRTEMSTIANT